MKAPKFTQGPWIVEDGYAVVSEQGDYIASCSDIDSGKSTKEANANLIAAAPDIYEALRLMVQLATAEVHIGRAVLDSANAALAKAEGK